MASSLSKPKEEDELKASDEAFDDTGASDETFDHICDVCVHKKHVEAKAYCADCCQNLCSCCQRTHDRLNANKDHSVLTGTEFTEVHSKGPGTEHGSRERDRPKLADNKLLSSGEKLNKTHLKSGPSFRTKYNAKDVVNIEDFDTGSTEVCGIEVAMNGYLLICDRGNRKMSLFDTRFKVLSEVPLPSAPRSIALLSRNDHKTIHDVLLSFSGNFRLQYVKIENAKKLTLGSSIQTSVEFGRIIKYKDDLIAHSEDTQSNILSVVDRRGKIKQTIRREMKGSGMFQSVYFMALSKDNTTLYVTDFYNGCFGFTMAGDVVFTYRGGGSNNYVGVATDTEGFVYISVPDTNTIVMDNKEGNKVKDLVTLDGMNPGLLAYDSLRNKLFVKEFFGSKIYVFTLEQY